MASTFVLGKAAAGPSHEEGVAADLREYEDLVEGRAFFAASFAAVRARPVMDVVSAIPGVIENGAKQAL
jgi:hypothetical protein